MSVQYPKMTISDVRDFLDTVVLYQVSDDAVSGFFLRKGYPAPSQQEDAIIDLVWEIMKAAGGETDVKLERVEAEFSGRVHALLDGFDDAALGDIDFWSYLAVRFFWPFVHARQHASWSAAEGKPTDPDRPDAEKLKLERYLIGRDHYQIPLRMYLRGQAIKDGDDYSLAEVPGTDFWRSQILGVRTSHYPSLARAVVRTQKDRDLGVEEQRPPGRRVNRLRSNIEFARRTDEENEELVSDLWKITKADVEALSAKKATRKKAAASKKAASKATSSGSEASESL
jgi:hypothetical protein